MYSASWKPTSLRKPSQNASKIDAKSMKIDIYMDQNFVCFLSGLLMALGGEHGPKSLPKRSPGGVNSSCFRAWRGLGGLLGALGLQDPPRADFWTQLDRIWPQLGPKMGHLGLKMSPCWGYVRPKWDPRPPQTSQDGLDELLLVCAYGGGYRSGYGNDESIVL